MSDLTAFATTLTDRARSEIYERFPANSPERKLYLIVKSKAEHNRSSMQEVLMLLDVLG